MRQPNESPRGTRKRGEEKIDMIENDFLLFPFFKKERKQSHIVK